MSDEIAWCEVDVEVVGETPDTWVVLADGNRTVYLPKSECEDFDGPVPSQVCVSITVPEWLALDRGLI